MKRPSARRAVAQQVQCVSVQHFSVPGLGGVRVDRTGALGAGNDVFVNELTHLREFESLGPAHVNEQEIQVTERGWFLVRVIAMVFDRQLQFGKAPERFLRII